MAEGPDPADQLPNAGNQPAVTLDHLARFSVPSSVHYICMDWRHITELLTVGRHAYAELINLCVWAKNSGGMGSFYRSRHELIFVFANEKGMHRNNVQLGRYGRNRTNVWEYPGVVTQSRQGEEGNLLALHPTVKPVALIADAILDASVRGEIVLDAFLGSGSTLLTFAIQSTALPSSCSRMAICNLLNVADGRFQVGGTQLQTYLMRPRRSNQAIFGSAER